MEFSRTQRTPDSRIGRAAAVPHGKALLRQPEARTKDIAGKYAAAPPAVHEVLASTGRQLDEPVRSAFEGRFGHDFSKVRIHNDARAAESARQVHALAYTVGRDIVFGAGQYAPDTAHGRALLAHELSHTIQQGESAQPNASLALGDNRSPLEQEARAAGQAALGEHGAVNLKPGLVAVHIQRQPDPLTTQTPDMIIANDAYIDNHLKSIEFYSAQVAILHYEDGSKLRLGLVPQFIQAPVEGVDYRTLRSSHIPIIPTKPGELQYFPRGKETINQLPDTSTVTLGELLRDFTRTVTFKRDPASSRIVPTQVNSITAPRLCQVLREAETEYVNNFNALAAGGKKVFEKLQTIVEIAGFLPAGEGAAQGVAERAGARGAAAAAAGAEGTIARKFLELLGRKAAGEITVEGVVFGDIEVAQEGTQLLVRRSLVQNVGRLPNQGKIMQAVWESAAVQAARQVGAKSVQIAVRTVLNQTWAAYLESQGYMWEWLPKLFGQIGGEKALVKTITL